VIVMIFGISPCTTYSTGYVAVVAMVHTSISAKPLTTHGYEF